jgi:hypothetical protein
LLSDGDENVDVEVNDAENCIGASAANDGARLGDQIESDQIRSDQLPVPLL